MSLIGIVGMIKWSLKFLYFSEKQRRNSIQVGDSFDGLEFLGLVKFWFFDRRWKRMNVCIVFWWRFYFSIWEFIPFSRFYSMHSGWRKRILIRRWDCEDSRFEVLHRSWVVFYELRWWHCSSWGRNDSLVGRDVSSYWWSDERFIYFHEIVG